MVADLYYRPASGAAETIVALVSGLVVLFAGLAVAVWLAGRWMVEPLTRLSSQVDKVAGGDLAITVPRSRIGEITNIAQAVEGMTAALDETEQARAEADAGETIPRHQHRPRPAHATVRAARAPAGAPFQSR